MTPPTETPTHCYICGTALELQHRRAIGLYCPACEWAVWAWVTNHWVRRPPPTVEGRAQQVHLLQRLCQPLYYIDWKREKARVPGLAVAVLTDATCEGE